MIPGTPKYTNSLINETSPYLLQHAHNPVNWYAWNDETLEKAKKEDKLILISVGYSACHWCHVMEHESFEDETVAQLMNNHFICIKVDREERPDIDQIYMMAVQLMTGHGGWPLNCFALPDGRPIYGGTYFQKQQLLNVLLTLADLYSNEKEKATDYAKRLTEGVRLAELVKINSNEEPFTMDTLHASVKNWTNRFDTIDGGPDKAPKFPLPNNYDFLLSYFYFTKNKAAGEHISLTLKKMAWGGIYDQIGGGFSRYSVDKIWKVPHFEKMLYDNAQLVSLYCTAYKMDSNPLYKQVVFETLEFVARELTSNEGAFYSALDADSEGIEGKYYIWNKEELQEILQNNYPLFADYFSVNELGYWEEENYILLRSKEADVLAKKHAISLTNLTEIISTCKKTLLTIREKRVRPGLDNKILTSWNALMIKGLADAYTTFHEEKFLMLAETNADFISKKCYHASGTLKHIPNKPSGFLEDYCFAIDAFIALYQATFNEDYLLRANQLMVTCIAHFQDKETGMFYFTSDEDQALITRKMELSDNVIPASNSSIAKSLFILGKYFDNEAFIKTSRNMLNNVLDEIVSYGPGYSNWATLLLYFTQPFYEIAIVGKSVDEKRESMQKYMLPNVIFVGSATQSKLPLLKNRYVENETLIYVCENKTCLAPVKTIEEALKLVQQTNN